MGEFNGTTSGKYNEVDANNTSPSPDGAPAGSYFNQVEPIFRALMGATQRFWDRINGTVVSTGSSNAYTYTPVNTAYPSAYIVGEKYTFKANFANTGAATLNINNLGAKNLFQIGSSGPVALAGGEIQIGQFVEVLYDGTEFQILSPSAIVVPINNPAFTGTPTAPTAAAGTSTTQIATTAFVNSTALTLAVGSTAFTQPLNDMSANIATTAFVNQPASLNSNGFYKTPNGFIIQWGTTSSFTTGSHLVSFNETFPNNCFGVVLTPTSLVTFNVSSYGPPNFTLYTSGTSAFFYIALGN